MSKSLMIHIGAAAILAIVVIFGSTYLYNNIASYDIIYTSESLSPGNMESMNQAEQPLETAPLNSQKSAEASDMPILLIYIEYPLNSTLNTRITIYVETITLTFEDGSVYDVPVNRLVSRMVSIIPGEKKLVAAVPIPIARVTKVTLQLGDNMEVNGEFVKLRSPASSWEGTLYLDMGSNVEVTISINQFI